MNSPIKLEIAKLLKEKGYDTYTHLKYFSKKPSGYGIVNWSESTPYSCDDIYSKLSLGYTNQGYFTWAPTISDVVMWLYETHNVWIYVNKDYHNGALLGFESGIDTEDGLNDCGTFDSPTQAYEKAIEYFLKQQL